MRRAWAWLVRLLSGDPDPAWVREQEWAEAIRCKGVVLEKLHQQLSSVSKAMRAFGFSVAEVGAAAGRLSQGLNREQRRHP